MRYVPTTRFWSTGVVWSTDLWCEEVIELGQLGQIVSQSVHLAAEDGVHERRGGPTATEERKEGCGVEKVIINKTIASARTSCRGYVMIGAFWRLQLEL